jgi:hypothetical protein
MLLASCGEPIAQTLETSTATSERDRSASTAPATATAGPAITAEWAALFERQEEAIRAAGPILHSTIRQYTVRDGQDLPRLTA